MIAEIRRLDPKPGRGFGAARRAARDSRVFVTAAPDSSWRIELNSEALPRVLVNESLRAAHRRGAARETDRQFVSRHLQTANWLTKSLEQRARTILNVASEIVRRQDAFFIEGVAGLRPLNLKAVADAIGVHESTVSRATSNKFIQTPRGLFEMNISSPPRSPRRRRRSAFGRVGPPDQADDRCRGSREVLSDDVIVARLRDADIVVARRTVAEYRDNLAFPFRSTGGE